MQLRTIQRFEDDQGNVVQEWETVTKIQDAHTHTGGASPHPPPRPIPLPPASSSSAAASVSCSPPPPMAAPTATAPLAWRRWFDQVLDDGELWEGFAGLTAEQVLADAQVKRALVKLDGLQLAEPLQYVLRFGPGRVVQVCAFVETKRRTQGVSSPAGLARTLLERHPERASARNFKRRKHA